MQNEDATPAVCCGRTAFSEGEASSETAASHLSARMAKARDVLAEAFADAGKLDTAQNIREQNSPNEDLATTIRALLAFSTAERASETAGVDADDRIRECRDAFEAMHARAMKAEAAIVDQTAIRTVTAEMRRLMPAACGDWADRIDAALAGKMGPLRYRHVARGSLYEEIGTATLQNSKTSLSDGDRLVIYLGEYGNLWAREYHEFHDGRFVEVRDDDR